MRRKGSQEKMSIHRCRYVIQQTKYFKTVIIILSKEQKETAFKELKKNMMAMTQGEF